MWPVSSPEKRAVEAPVLRRTLCDRMQQLKRQRYLRRRFDLTAANRWTILGRSVRARLPFHCRPIAWYTYNTTH